MANITFIQVQEIFKTLPVGYYTGRNVPRELVMDDVGAYYDLASDRIVVSFPIIKRAIDNIKSLKNEEIETVVRTLLYHEVSHALLTPRNISVRDYVNILEDERIETILKSYYLDVDFKKLVGLVNNIDLSKPARDMNEAFYRLVRFRDGEKEWLKRLEDLIYEFRNVNASHYGANMVDEYTRFYLDFMHSQPSIQLPDSAKSLDNQKGEDKQDNQEQSQEQSQSQSQSQEQELQEGQQQDSQDSQDDQDDYTHDYSSDVDKIVDKAVESVFNKYIDSNLHGQFFNAIDMKIRENKNKGAAINSYSGRIDKKSVALRDDYKWFVKSNREGNLKRFSNLHINLFIDNSGSFRENATITNKIIKALAKVEKEIPQFSFDVITDNDNIVEWEDKNKEFKAYGGTYLPLTIKDVIRKHKKLNANTYNIVLFDGYCDTPYENTFKYFDDQNTTIISDPDNETNLDIIKKAKVIISCDYTKELVKNIIATLNKA